MTLFDLDPEGGGGEVGPPPASARAAAPARAAPAGVEKGPAQRVRLRLELAYDGSGFHGFAAQAGQRTVAGALAEAVSTVVRHPVEITCAGRTDAGVHALGQVVHLDVAAGVDPARLARSINALLSPAVVVRRADEVPADFDARRSARSRHYRYLVLEAAVEHPLLARYCWRVEAGLDVRAMAAAADALVGEHDFRAFCRRPRRAERDAPAVRRVLDARWAEQRPAPDGLGPGERLLRFDVWANAFCHQMVRTAVGTMVDVGRGRRRASEVVEMLRSGDRSRALTVAPPHGLCLVSVEYA